MGRQISVLALARDVGAGRVIEPVIRILRERGHKAELLLETEGRAKDFVPQPYALVNNLDMVVRAFESHRPDVVVAGLSSPRRYEEGLEEEAILNNVPVIHIEDYWGAHVRSRYMADLYVTVNEAAKRLILKRYAPVLDPRMIVIAGFEGIEPSSPSPELRRRMEDLRRDGTVLVYPDGGPECEDSLPMLVASVLKTKAPVVIVPKPHPKASSLPCPQGGTWADFVASALKPLRAQGRISYFDEGTREVADCADGVVSAYGSIVMRPAMVGKLALTLWTPAVRTLLTQETGLDATPLMLEQVFPVLSYAGPLDGFVEGPRPTLELKTYDANVAADAVVALVS